MGPVRDVLETNTNNKKNVVSNPPTPREIYTPRYMVRKAGGTLRKEPPVTRGENGESPFMDLGKVVVLVGKNPVGMVNILLSTRFHTSKQWLGMGFLNHQQYYSLQT